MAGPATILRDPGGQGARNPATLPEYAVDRRISRFPLFGGAVSEGACSLRQDLGLDLFIAAVALSAALNVADAFASGGVLGILGIGVTAALVPPLVAWVVGLKVLNPNPVF